MASEYVPPNAASFPGGKAVSRQHSLKRFAGETVLPFKSALLEPAARQTHALTAGLIGYELADGDASEEVCYWKDMTLVPHLVNLMSKRAVRVSVSFTEIRPGSASRKELARQLHSEVMRLKEAVPA